MIKLILFEAWLSISTNKLRSFLTTLGIIIGVCAVVMMVAAGQTVRNIINERFVEMGANLLMLRPGTARTTGVRGTDDNVRASMTIQDIQMVKEIKGVEAAAPIVSSRSQAVYLDKNWSVFAYGSTPDYLIAGNWSLDKGLILTDRDIRNATLHIVVGQTVVKELFQGADPIGEYIRIKNIPFKIIGTLKAKGENMMGHDQDNIVLMPITTMKRRFNNKSIPDLIDRAFVRVEDDADLWVVEDRIKRNLRAAHNLKDKDMDDFEIRNMAELVKNIEMIGLVLSILLSAIASISLIVGSIGIVNMMLVSVTERTREIGIRKAIGAFNKWIMLQFLSEAVLISFMGSVLGLIFGILFSQIAGYIMEVSVPISMWAVVLSFLVAVVVGISSGIFPAMKAMKLNPIEALRYS